MLFVRDSSADCPRTFIAQGKVRPGCLRRRTVVAALITSFAIEFSQMLTPDWLVKIRSTFLGHMLLGQGFLWSDLLAYTIGIAVIYGLTALIRKGVSEK